MRKDEIYYYSKQNFISSFENVGRRAALLAGSAFVAMMAVAATQRHMFASAGPSGRYTDSLPQLYPETEREKCELREQRQ